MYRSGLLQKTAPGFDIAVPKFTTTDHQAFTWVKRDVSVVLALLKNCGELYKKISGGSYPVVTANISYAELAAVIAKSAYLSFKFKYSFNILVRCTALGIG